MIICIYFFKDFIHITILINNNKLTVLTNPDFCAVYLDLTADNPLNQPLISLSTLGLFFRLLLR